MSSTIIEREYEKILENFCDHGDIGDDWCGEDVVQALLTWIKSNFDTDDRILDIGCGNASLLFQLYHLGFTNVIGIDKAASAIKLATEISHQECAKIKFEVADVLESVMGSEKVRIEKEGSLLNQKYKLILDKGLFDSASSVAKDAEEFRAKYIKNIQTLLLSGGILLMATCSYTEEEVKSYLEKGFQALAVLPTPILEYKGKKGHNVTVIAFQRKN